MFGIAWISALALSGWVYKTSTAPSRRDTVQAVAARKDLAVGMRLALADLKLVTVDRKDAPQGVASRISDLVNRTVVTPVAENELVLERKLASKGGGDSLSALIEPGMRAISVKVDDTTGVAGFVQPGTRVDVLFTRILPNGDAATTTILQNIKVVAYGKQLEVAKPDSKAPLAGGGQTVATLLVTQEDSERVALAVQRGRIHLVLRNPLDDKIEEPSEPTRSADLGIEDPVRPEPRPAVVKAPSAESRLGPKPAGVTIEQGPKQPNNGRITVRVFRGSKVSEDIF